MVVVVTLLCWAIVPHFDKASLIMIYLAGVAWVAVRFGRWPSALAAALSVAAFDFFFVAPHLTFAVGDAQYLVTFTVMLAVALLISGLAVRLRDQAEASRQRERRTDVLYSTSRELSGLTDPDEVVRAVSRQIMDVIHGPAMVFLPGDDGRLRASTPDTAFASDPREQAVAEWVFRHGRRAGVGTDTPPGGTALHVPLPGAQGSVGVVAVRPHPSLLPLSPDHLDLLETLARLAAAPLERARLAASAERARLEVEAERLRNALLSSVSHDIRTPLAVIMGAATGLVEQRQSGASADSELADTILVEADRLNRVVTNLLDMTRLESGAVRLKSEWHSVEELVGGALARMERALGGWRVETAVPADLPLVPVDALLVERVLVNLLDNAAKHTPPGSTIRISASSLGDAVQVEVADNGPGLSPGEQERIFEKFFRKPSERPAGFGLGLAICRAIVQAHGGRIWAENVANGASLRFILPVKGSPPELRAPEANDDSAA